MITLKNLGEATPIQVFNQAKEHLLKQGERSVSDLNCMYRSDNGLKCAAGCFIADEEYNEWMEGKTWDVLVNNLPGRFPHMFGYDTSSHKALIYQLQIIHDSCGPEDWEFNLGLLEQEVLSGKYDQ